jgi:glutathione peroxidase-family protein
VLTRSAARAAFQIDVNGPKTSPVYQFLKTETKSGDVNWNFGAKFIIGKDGKVLERTSESPMKSEAKIKALL